MFKETTKMAFQLSLTIIFGIIACFLSMALATPGTATFYTQYVPSECYGKKDSGVMIAAASDLLWNNGAICGTLFNVTCTGRATPIHRPCTGKSVLVKIVDHCRGYCGGTLDLSKEAFAAIANPLAMVVKIDYVPLIGLIKDQRGDGGVRMVL